MTRLRSTLDTRGEEFRAAEAAMCVRLEEIDGEHAKAIAGEITGMTGMDAPYEPPAHPELRLDGTAPLDLLVSEVLALLAG